MKEKDKIDELEHEISWLQYKLNIAVRKNIILMDSLKYKKRSCPHPYVAIKNVWYLNHFERPQIIDSEEPVSFDNPPDQIRAFLVVCTKCFTKLRIFPTQTSAQKFVEFYNDIDSKMSEDYIIFEEENIVQ